MQIYRSCNTWHTPAHLAVTIHSSGVCKSNGSVQWSIRWHPTYTLWRRSHAAAVQAPARMVWHTQWRQQSTWQARADIWQSGGAGTAYHAGSFVRPCQQPVFWCSTLWLRCAWNLLRSSIFGLQTEVEDKRDSQTRLVRNRRVKTKTINSDSAVNRLMRVNRTAAATHLLLP